MLKLLRPLLVPASILVAGLALGGAVLADSQDAAGNPPPAKHEHSGHHGPFPAFARALHQVNLTDSQKSQIHDLLKADHEAMRTQFKSLRDQHFAFDRAVPGSSDFVTAQANLVQAESAAVQTHVQHEADLHTKIYALLTDDQKSKLATALAEIQSKADEDAGPPPNE
jgi:Spy/CpxP family protein refolding chaperone